MIRTVVSMTGRATSTPDTLDDERRPGGVALGAGGTHGAITLTAAHSVTLDDGTIVALPADTDAVYGDGLTACNFGTTCFVTYLDGAGVFTACAQEHWAAIAAAADVWPLHYIHAPEIKRYQPRPLLAPPAPPICYPDLVWVPRHTTEGGAAIAFYTPEGSSTGWIVTGNGLDDSSGAVHVGKPVLLVDTEIWVVNADCTISRFTPDRLVAGAVIAPPTDTGYLAMAALVLPSVAEVWVLNQSGDTNAGAIYRYHYDGSSAGAPITGGGMPSDPSDMQPAGDQVWVGNATSATIARFHLDGSSVGSTISAATGRRRQLGTMVGDQFWALNGVINSGDSAISRFHLDGSSAGADLTAAGLDRPQQIVTLGGIAWVATAVALCGFNADGSAATGSPWTDPLGIVSLGDDVAVVGAYLWVRDSAGRIAVLQPDLTRIGTIGYDGTQDYLDPLSDWWAQVVITGVGLTLRSTAVAPISVSSGDGVTLLGLTVDGATLRASTNTDLNPTLWYVVIVDEANTVIATFGSGSSFSHDLWQVIGSGPVTHTYHALLSDSGDLTGTLIGPTNTVTLTWPAQSACAPAPGAVTLTPASVTGSSTGSIGASTIVLLTQQNYIAIFLSGGD